VTARGFGLKEIEFDLQTARSGILRAQEGLLHSGILAATGTSHFVTSLGCCLGLSGFRGAAGRLLLGSFGCGRFSIIGQSRHSKSRQYHRKHEFLHAEN